MTAWKDLELRVCRAFGGQRRGPTGHALSDCVGTQYAIEIKRSKRGVPEGRWIEQARLNAAKEKRPWILVIARHNDRKPIAVLELSELLRLTQIAGTTPPPDSPEENTPGP